MNRLSSPLGAATTAVLRPPTAQCCRCSDGPGRGAAVGDDNLWVLAYGSASVAPMGEAELHAVLEASRRNNARAGVTGLLLYRDQSFFQVLEGAERAVHDTYRRIRADPRHRGCHTFLRRRAPARLFPDCTMGLRTGREIAEEHRLALDGLVRRAHAPGAESARAVAKLIEAFHRITT